MFFIVLATFYPFYYMLMLSLSGGETYAKVLLVPSGPTISAYDLMINNIKFFESAFISFLRILVGPVLTITVSYFGAYVLARRDLVFRKFLSRFIVFAMYFSAGLLPVYLNMVSLHLTRSFLVYIIPGLVNVFELILIRTYIEDLPRSIEESATIDGANDLRIAAVIVMPLCIPVLAAVMLFEFVNHWNAYIDTLLYNATVPELYTLQYALSNYIKSMVNISATNVASNAALGSYNIQSVRMAMTVVVCIPSIIVYPFLQRYFIKGIMIGSIKG
jgi:putative aldouronate transport system permease protein